MGVSRRNRLPDSQEFPALFTQNYIGECPSAYTLSLYTLILQALPNYTLIDPHQVSIKTVTSRDILKHDSFENILVNHLL